MAMTATDRASHPLPTILFDLDGTLIDSIELILNSARHAFHKLDRTCPPDEEWLAGVGIPLFTMFRRYARDEADCAALIAAYREYQVIHHDRNRHQQIRGARAPRPRPCWPCQTHGYDCGL
jgi:phosphoglycolate phosphatase-like HAD superfamily hydrolase